MFYARVKILSCKYTCIEAVSSQMVEKTRVPGKTTRFQHENGKLSKTRSLPEWDIYVNLCGEKCIYIGEENKKIYIIITFL